MNRMQSKHGLSRIWPALGAVAMMAAWMAGSAGALAAEPPASVRTWTGAVSANWADGGNWTGGAAPGAADDVVIDGGKSQPVLDLAKGAVTVKSLTLGGKTAAATLSLANGNVTDKILIIKGDVTVGTNGVLTHANEIATGTAVGDETQRLGLEIGGNLTIGAGGAIRVAGCGYAKGAGPYKANGGSGGVHGGEGGSVNIRAGELLGNGSISAKGGDGVQNNGGGGAGGGRIAVVLTKAATFGSVTMSAAGGTGGGKDMGYGAAGTIYLQGAGQAAGRLIVSNPPLAGVGGARTLIGPEVTGDVPADARVPYPLTPRRPSAF